jgi:hypothetical protein
MNGAKFVAQLKFQVALLNKHCIGDFKAIYGLILQADWSKSLAFAIPVYVDGYWFFLTFLA